MPYASDAAPEQHLLRTFVYGPAKTKKTWWACRCAEFGFNVILLDGDDGALITKQLPLEAQKKILTVDLTMRNDRTVFALFMAQLLRPNNSFVWDEKAAKTVFGLDPKHANIKFDASLLTANDVIVLDGWKALSESTLFQFAEENKIDLSDAEKVEWAGYGYQGNFLNWVLARLHSLPCQVIVIGHSTVYEKWDRRSPNPKEHKIIEQRTQPISCTGPHAKKLAAHFTDVLYFEKYSESAYKINTGGDRDRDGGSRLFEAKIYDWKDLGPDKFFDKLGLKATGAPCAGAVWYAPGVEIPRGGKAPQGPTQAGNDVQKKPGEMSAPIPNQGTASLLGRLAMKKA